MMLCYSTDLFLTSLLSPILFQKLSILNDMNTCGQCAKHFEGLVKDCQDPML